MGAVDLTDVTVQRSVRIRAFFSDVAGCGRLLSVTFRSCCYYYRLTLFSLFAFVFYRRQVVRVLSIHEGNRTAVSLPPENELIPANLLRPFDERDLELLIGGICKIDTTDWQANTRLKV